MDNVLGVLFCLEGAFKLPGLDLVGAGNGVVGAIFVESEGDSALDLYQVNSDRFVVLRSEGEVDHFVALIHGVLLTQALGEVQSGYLSFVFGFCRVVSCVGFAGLVNSLDYRVDGQLGSFICVNSDVEGFGQIVLFESQRVEK